MTRLHPNRARTLIEAQEHNDCGVRALAATCNVPYKKAYKTLERLGRKPRGLTYFKQLVSAISLLGKCAQCSISIRKVSIKNIARELPKGSWVVSTRGHWVAVVDGEVIDWSRGHLLRPKYALEVTD